IDLDVSPEVLRESLTAWAEEMEYSANQEGPYQWVFRRGRRFALVLSWHQYRKILTRVRITYRLESRDLDFDMTIAYLASDVQGDALRAEFDQIPHYLRLASVKALEQRGALEKWDPPLDQGSSTTPDIQKDRSS